MLEDMGVHVVEDPGLCVKAAYVESVSVLLIRPGLSPDDLARAVDLALLGQVPQQRRPATS